MKKPVKIILGILVFGLISAGCFIAVTKGPDLVKSVSNVASVADESKDAKENEEDRNAAVSGEDESSADNGESLNGNEESESIAQGTVADTSAYDSSGSVSKIVKNVMPAIVSINCTAYYQQSDVFGRRYNTQGTGAGSGIIIGQNEDEVLVVTNAHVVNGQEPKVSVVFCNDKEYDAQIKGSDTESDLAVVSVEISDMDDDTLKSIKIASIGSSDDIEVGEMAIAIGNALGYGQSVTVGYISAKDRQIDIEDSSQTMSLIQTDAAINPGNSGGALINLKGEIIGINSAKFSSTEVEGMGYAIPISDALPIITALMNEEEIEHKKAYLGIVGTDISEEDSQAFQMPSGIYIREVSDNSPAKEAGLMAGQIIVKCDDEAVTMAELENILSRAKSGDTLNLTVKQLNMGNYEEKTVTVTLGEKTTDTDEQDEEESQTDDSRKSRWPGIY